VSEQQPVAWSVGNPALVSGIARSVSVHPQRKWAEASARHSGVSEDDILPLYLAPTLTDAEREAIRRAIRDMSSLPMKAGGDEWAAATLRGLLERTR
jgi:hypothetical protein